MSEVTVGSYILIIILIIFSAFFSATETAFSSLNKTRLKNLISNGNESAKKAMYVYENYDKAISAILIGNNVVNIASASLGTLIFTTYLGSTMGASVSTIAMTIVVLIFGEVLPKSIAKENSEKFALTVSPLLVGFMKILTPFTYLLSLLIRGVNRVFSKKEKEPSYTDDEIKIIIEESEDEGVLEQHESELVQLALEFRDISVDEVLTPRVNIVAIDKNESIDNYKALLINEGYSRIPVYEKNIDNVIGVINSKDFLVEYINTNANVNIEKLIQKTLFVPPKKRIDRLLKEMQELKIHIAIVTDQYGGTIGLVTFEDLIEELVGEIWDESDEVKTEITKISENKYLVNGDTDIDDLLDYLDFDDNEYDIDSNTVGGLALENFEKIPTEGETFRFLNLEFKVVTVADNRIMSLQVEVL